MHWNDNNCNYNLMIPRIDPRILWLPYQFTTAVAFSWCSLIVVMIFLGFWMALQTWAVHTADCVIVQHTISIWTSIAIKRLQLQTMRSDDRICITSLMQAISVNACYFRTALSQTMLQQLYKCSIKRKLFIILFCVYFKTLIIITCTQWFLMLLLHQLDIYSFINAYLEQLNIAISKN